ncbi:dipeptidase [Alkaliphilus transvaalensis]|uniref:dipeptidase n=1 Tax=Alkaliphilus transvaalensis TaxID=114628 RepID=UPI00047C0F01|nr:dipeptidase [Alkaliphilus transvaalensis]
MKYIDLHCDTIFRMFFSEEKTTLKKNDYQVDLEKLKKSNAIGQFFALFFDLSEAKKRNYSPYEVGMKMLDLFDSEIAINKEEIALATNYVDLEKNQQEGKISAFLAVEEGGVLEGKIDYLQKYYDRGARLITLTWNHPNEVGFPNINKEYSQQGLTSFGRVVVEAMNELGMIIDVSHLSDAGFYDVAQLSSKPFIASHSNARAVRDHSRNLTDDMVKILADKGGVTGINFAAYFLGEDKTYSKVEDMITHIKHLRNVGGIEIIALGTDFDGIGGELEIKDFSQMYKLVDALEKHKFTSEEIEKICYKNTIRVIKDVMK